MFSKNVFINCVKKSLVGEEARERVGASSRIGVLGGVRASLLLASDFPAGFGAPANSSYSPEKLT